MSNTSISLSVIGRQPNVQILQVGDVMIFVVGPSRSGKTTLLNAVIRRFPRLRLLDLDDEERRSVKLISAAGGDPGGWEGRWSRNMECLRLAIDARTPSKS